MIELRCVLLSGSHASGKTTLTRWAEERTRRFPGYRFFTEGGGRTICTMPVDQAFEALWPLWWDPEIHTLVIEGTRVYATVFRVMLEAAKISGVRSLWTLQLLQAPEVGRAHMRARCARKNKPYHAYWDSKHGAHEFWGRYENAYARAWDLVQAVGAPVGAWDAVEVDLEYTVHALYLQAWMARALRLKTLAR